LRLSTFNKVYDDDDDDDDNDLDQRVQIFWCDVINKHIYENQLYCKTKTKLKPKNKSIRKSH